VTISANEVSYSQWTGNGVTTVFDYEFKITAASELKVTVTASNGGVSVLSLNTDYTVSGVGNNAGGQITLAAPLANLSTILIEDNVPLSQDTPFGNQAQFFARSHEDAFDKLTRLTVRAFSTLARALRAPSNEPNASMLLPAAGTRANKILAFGAAGEALVSDILPGSTAFNRSTIGLNFYPRTDAEIAAGITPTYYYYEPGDVRRYGAVANNGDVTKAAANTAAIQAAINVTSYQNGMRVYVPGGHYIYNTVYGFYDVTLNPDFSQSTDDPRQGRSLFYGDGKMGVTSLTNITTGTDVRALYEGSVLEAASGQRGLVIGGDAEGHKDSPRPAREFTARDITFIADNTTYAVEAAGPSYTFENCSFLQRNNAGNGVFAKSSWWTSFKNCNIFGPDNLTSTGVGIVGGTSTSAGQFHIGDKTTIKGFRDSVEWSDTDQFRNLSITETQLDFGRYGVNVGSIIEIFNFERNHVETLEGTEISAIHATAAIQHVNVSNNWFLAGDTSGNGATGPLLDFSSVSDVQIEGNSIYRPYADFCNITAVSSGIYAGVARNNSFISGGSTAVGPLYMFTGILPELDNNLWTGFGSGLDAAGAFNLYDTTTQAQALMTCAKTQTKVIPRLSVGAVTVATGLSTQYTVSATTGQTVYDLTCTAAIDCTLPNDATQLDGRVFVIKNNTASSHAITVKNSSGSAITNGDLPAGYTGLFTFDNDNGTYIVLMVSANT
jgi:hypothetical protein